MPAENAGGFHLELTGRYDARTIAIMPQALDGGTGHGEACVEEMDPTGRTVAYFVDHGNAQTFLDHLNGQPIATEHDCWHSPLWGVGSVVDHLVIGAEGRYVSFAGENLL